VGQRAGRSNYQMNGSLGLAASSCFFRKMTDIFASFRRLPHVSRQKTLFFLSRPDVQQDLRNPS
jgi:hypothetical protein